MKINIQKLLSGNFQVTFKVTEKASIILICHPDEKLNFIEAKFNQLLKKVK